MAQVEEAALVVELQAGEARAYETLVRTYGGRMRGAILQVLRDETDADDTLQEAFVSAFRALPRFERRSGLGTWLHRIAVNAALMRLRSQRRYKEVEVEELLPRFTDKGVHFEPQRPWQDREDDPLEREELCAQVRACIAKLPEKHRIPLLLRDIEGLGNEELARELGVTVNAAKIRLHRARQALRTLLEPEFNKESG